MDEASREMTLEEYCGLLHENHRARKELKRLLETQKWADALTAAGVDNWDGYDYAMDMIEDL